MAAMPPLTSFICASIPAIFCSTSASCPLSSVICASYCSALSGSASAACLRSLMAFSRPAFPAPASSFPAFSWLSPSSAFFLSPFSVSMLLFTSLRSASSPLSVDDAFFLPALAFLRFELISSSPFFIWSFASLISCSASLFSCSYLARLSSYSCFFSSSSS